MQAGLFAGVNTAFLSLTIPLLSANPTDDTNALLVQNNALLTQLVTGRNDTTPIEPPAIFTLSIRVFLFNTLFAVSLAFAIVSSFLAMIGRQWLVYYRRSGGRRSDLQRWEQLKRFLGARRWHLEPLVDHSIPLLLQSGLLIFFVSLVLYIHHLNPLLSLIVGVTLASGLLPFVVTGLFTLWDRFCPFHSALFYALLGWVIGLLKATVLFGRTFLGRDLRRREEERPETLKAIALHRTICESDDPETLLHTISNIIAVGERHTMNVLWVQADFRWRFLELYRNPSDGVSRLVGYIGSPSDLAESARQLYRGAAAHILLTIHPDLQTSDALQSCANLVSDIASLDASTILKPTPPLGKPSPNFTRSNLGLFAIWRRSCDDAQAYIDSIGNYLVACSEVLACTSDLQLLLFFSWIVYWYTGTSTPCSEPVGRVTEASRAIYPPPQIYERRERRTLGSFERIRNAYTRLAITFVVMTRMKFWLTACFPCLARDPVDVASVVQGAFQALLRAESNDLFDCDVVLTNIFGGIERILADEQVNPDANVQRAFELLESCERVLRGARAPPAAREIGESLRMKAAQLWRREYIARRARPKYVSNPNPSDRAHEAPSTDLRTS